MDKKSAVLCYHSTDLPNKISITRTVIFDENFCTISFLSISLGHFNVTRSGWGCVLSNYQPDLNDFSTTLSENSTSVPETHMRKDFQRHMITHVIIV